MRRFWIVWLVCSVCWAAGGCSKTQNGTEQTVADGGGKESGPNVPTCVSIRQCKDTEDCREGRCVSAEPCQDHNECPLDQRCTEYRCTTRCEVDTDCPKEHVCADSMCHKPEWKRGKVPNEGKTETKPLRVGLGVTDLDHPLSVSMAGYGFRPGPKTTYAKALGGSTGMYDRFKVKALVLDNGVERVAIVRSPLVFTTDFLLTQVVQRIIAKTGDDFLHKILVVATHSHSAPARYWNLLPHLNFGAFGGGDFHPEIFRRLVESFADAIIEANKNLAPGAFGYAVDNDFDPDGKVFSDRRPYSDRYKHPFLLVMRVDKADGTPLAALVSYPMHGTISDNTMMTNDAAGGLEYILQEKLEAKLGKRVEAFFLQGNAGDVSPRGDSLGHKSTQQMQMVGHFATPRVIELYDSIKPSKEMPNLEYIHRRIPISRKHIGYKEGEFFEQRFGKNSPIRFGAFQCVGDGYDFRKAPEKTHIDGKLGCIFSVELLHGAPVPQFSKTHLSAMRLGELVLASLPGESTSWLAKRIRDGVVDGSKGKLKDFFSVGYAQDHQLYLLEEKDWWRGGYEAATTIWGPKFGEYLIKESIALALQLTTPQKEKNETGILPQDFYKFDFSPTIPRVKTPDAGKVDAPPTQYMRMDKPMSFSFFGGFIGIDNPHVTLQKKAADGSFKDVMRPGGLRPYDDGDYRMIMTFNKVAADRFRYTFSFEELEDFPTGTYRFRIAGQQWDGTKRVPYTAETAPFEIVASDRIQLTDLKLTGDKLTGRLAYPAGTNDDGKSPFDKLKMIGHRVRSTLVHREVGPPLPESGETLIKVTIAQNGSTVQTLESKTPPTRSEATVKIVTSREKDGKEATRNQKALVSTFEIATQQALPPGEYDVTIEVTDPHGNTGKRENIKLTVDP